ncbi:putative disease resistance protein RGA4 [Ananas comosus]|uniref:Putative disease resistance protein RGA4 n=1 Tax=Ananas comosus TaxID=4615 RepID=A0A199W272_ANACO|nr:putative disease resistance protein RGA4 [Ananas comosus]
MQDELERLQYALPQVQAVLTAIEEGAPVTPQYRALDTWLWQLRDAVECAEDVLDELEYYELEKAIRDRDDKVRGILSKCKRKFDGFVNCIYSDGTLKRLREAVKGLDRVVAGMGPLLQLVNGLYGPGVKRQKLQEVRNARETSSLLTESEVLGRDEERDLIVKWLIKPGDADVSAFTIVGMGGLGKTTLAQLVYRNESVQDYFDPIMWVCVSQDFDAVAITRKMLEGASSESFGDMSLNALHYILKQKISSKRFLLMLDDVWNDDKTMEWEKLVAPLKLGQRGSKILLTTRMDSVADMVAKVMQCKRESLNLNGLEERDYMSLFNKHAFLGMNPDDYKNLQPIGKQIAKKLGGCPLAIKVMGGLLNFSMDYDYWKRILKEDIMNLRQGKDCIMTVLRLSYDHLPTNLQSGYKIGELRKLRDLRHLCIRELENVRSSEEAMEAKLNEKEYLKSLSLQWSRDRSNTAEADEQLLDNLCPHINLKKLRIKNYQGVKSPCWMTDLSLINLTSIELIDCKEWEHFPPLQGLPSLNRLYLSGLDLECFQAFESLIIEQCEKLEYLPLEFFRKFNILKYLCIEKCPKLTKRGISGIQLPSILNQLTVGSCGDLEASLLWSANLTSLTLLELLDCASITSIPPAQVCARWTMLSHLEIRNCAELSSFGGIQALVSLRSLEIRGCDKLIAVSLRQPPFPNDVGPKNAMDCFLKLGELSIDHHMLLLMDPLRSLSSISRLTLSDNSQLTTLPDKWLLQNHAALKNLSITNACSLQSLPQSMTKLCSLEILEVWNANLIQSLPDLPTSLRTLYIIECHPALKERCQKNTGLDWPKIANIPNLNGMMLSLETNIGSFYVTPSMEGEIQVEF